MAAPTPTAAAPWRAQLLDHISKLDSPTFTFSSLHPGTGSSSSSQAEPRGRTCVFRGMWASLPHNDKNNASRNPDAFESDCLTLTTDARMAKVPELFESGETGSSPPSSSSGGGGPVEAMFWVAQAGTQWRVRGRAWVLSHADIGGAGAGDPAGSSPGAKAARDAIWARMRPATTTDSAGQQQWSWEREVEAHFGNLSPGMRGSFKNPPPGTPRAEEPGPGEGLGQKVGDELLGDEVARRNFRVVVIVPEEVDTWDGKDPDNQRRWVYTFVGPGAKATKAGGQVIDGWEKVEVWP
ncbi:putative zn 2cys6 transcription factor [Diaporthe ampelina]|uniref:Putative zn 2cys6 transcription factor n=1 Tax=Diaporthe ampelina TaxID=1214573 RepID=A0A0G2HYV3_9PEZI|nr:putative zn 2cys6 transcription factor [Diaporthe ampelina]